MSDSFGLNGSPGVTAGPEREVPVAWRLSEYARRLVTLGLAGLVIAVIARRPEFAGLAAPALLLLVPRQSSRPPTVTLTLDARSARLTEAEQSTILARVSGADGYTVSMRLHSAGWITANRAVLGPDGWFRLPFRSERWGVRQAGTIEITLFDRWRLNRGTILVEGPQVICYPLPARLESRVVLSKLPARLGDHRSRASGEGMEFAGVREFVPGDRQRRINWPATTRRGTLQLNTFAAERAQVVVILMDVSTDVGTAGTSTADLAVRAAAGTAASYLSVRDRVGLISFGRRVRWISPAAGRRQADRVMAMIMTDTGDGERMDAVTSLPHAALPPGALIIVISPLLSLRLIETLRELRERGFATIVIDVLAAEPEVGGRLTTGRVLLAGGSIRQRAMADLARRVWRMEQDAIRFSLRQLGIPVVFWDGTTSLDEPLAPYSRRALVNRA
jgi:uncharacterized protein (DUF58 family)